MRSVSHLAIVGLLLAAPPSWAQLDIASVRRLVDTGQADTAYATLVEHVDTLEGDPLFDFLFGLAAIDSGRAEEGVFALSRVVMLQPRNARARLELARGFYLLGEDTRAREEFEAVLAQEPPVGVRRSVRRFLDAISAREATYKTSGSLYAQVALGYDSNINSAPASDPYALLLGQETAWASERGSAFGQVDLGGQYSYPLSRRSALFGRLDGTWRGHGDGSRFDNGSLTGQGGIAHQLGEDQYRLTGILQRYAVDGATFRELTGVSGEWSHPASPRLRYGTSMTYAQLAYPDQPVRDGRLMNVGFSLLGGVGRGAWFGGLFVGREQADDNSAWTDASVDRQFVGAKAGLQWPIDAATSVTASATLQTSRYAGEWAWPEEGFERKRREDRYGAVDLELKRRLGENLSLIGHLSHADNGSSVASYDYTRSQVRLGLRYEL